MLFGLRLIGIYGKADEGRRGFALLGSSASMKTSEREKNLFTYLQI
jgi:hypothetical protein